MYSLSKKEKLQISNLIYKKILLIISPESDMKQKCRLCSLIIDELTRTATVEYIIYLFAVIAGEKYE